MLIEYRVSLFMFNSPCMTLHDITANKIVWKNINEFNDTYIKRLLKAIYLINLKGQGN